MKKISKDGGQVLRRVTTTCRDKDGGTGEPWKQS